MFARTKWVIPMLLLGLSTVPGYTAGKEVGVYLRSAAGAPGPVLDAMRAELESSMGEAGYRLRWWIGAQQDGKMEAEEVIVVDLRGACRLPPPSGPRALWQLPHTELASTSISGSQILPFTTLDCAMVNGLLAGALFRESPTRRDLLYGRALGRVLAHEFYHILAGTQKHAAKGIAKRTHSSDDLIGERFGFDPDSIAHLRQMATGPEKAGYAASPEPVVSSGDLTAASSR